MGGEDVMERWKGGKEKSTILLLLLLLFTLFLINRVGPYYEGYACVFFPGGRATLWKMSVSNACRHLVPLDVNESWILIDPT